MIDPENPSISVADKFRNWRVERLAKRSVRFITSRLPDIEPDHIFIVEVPGPREEKHVRHVDQRIRQRLGEMGIGPRDVVLEPEMSALQTEYLHFWEGVLGDPPAGALVYKGRPTSLPATEPVFSYPAVNRYSGLPYIHANE